jgi:hypothetical protein
MTSNENKKDNLLSAYADALQGPQEQSLTGIPTRNANIVSL